VAIDDRSPDDRLALRLEWATIGWNLGEVVITVTLGVLARSIALVAFGMDSLIEVFASGVVVWHVTGRVSAERTIRAHRLIGVAFIALAAGLVVSGGRRLVTGELAADSPLGIAYVALAALAMFGLAAWKKRLAERSGSTPLAAEAAITFLDGVLASSILLALVLTAWKGWWWVDPAAALLVAAFALREGVENLRFDE